MEFLASVPSFNRVLNTIPKRARHQVGQLTHQALTIHGIQTFGAWQRRLRILARNKYGKGNFFTYRYGVFSFVSFFIPFFRNREVRRLKIELLNIFHSLNGEKIAVFCHSFGTFLALRALKELLSEGAPVPVHTLVMAGSVLQSGTDLEFLRAAEIRLVNDCADHDYVLYLSQAFVLDTGMAGKCGFYGVQDRFRVNRFFLGGHSSYFDGDAFMEKYWLPLLDSQQTLDEIDFRVHSSIRYNTIDRFLTFLGYIKPVWYLISFLVLTWLLFR